MLLRPPRLALASAACTRRRFLIGLAAGSAALVAAPRRQVAAALSLPTNEPPRAISFVHTHTAESLSTVYWQDGDYVPEALARIDYLLRDWRTGEVAPMDPRLLDLLHDLARDTGTQEPFHVICGYRTRATNAALRACSAGVAEHSQHILGHAIDVRLPGVRTADLRDAALAMRRGGVGYYASTDFVHVDTGRVRAW